MKILFVLLISGLFIMTMTASKDNDQGKFFPYDYKVETLENGLKVVMIKTQNKGVLSYYSVVRTGSRDEYEPGHSGFAHFFEHMMFRGTKKHPGSEYDRILTEIGADGNAYTTDDLTCFHLSITNEDLEKVVELESDRFQNLFYEEREFQTEAGAVYGEYRKDVTDPFFMLWEKMQDAAFEVHPYKHTTMGFERDIKAMPTMYDYSRTFFQRYYRPENVIIEIAGDIDFAATLDLIKKYYSSWQTGYVKPPIPIEPEQKGGRAAEVKYPGKTLPLITIAYKGDAFNPNDKSVVSALLLGQLAFGENSDLFKRLYLKEQKVQYLMPDFGQNRDPFLWIILAMVKNESDLNYVQQQIYETIENFQKAPPTQLQLDNLKKRLKYSFIMSMDTPDRTAQSLARILAISGDMEAINQYFATIAGIKPDDIQQAAQKYFVAQKRTVTTLTGSN